MNLLERYSIKKLREFFVEAVNEGLTVGEHKIDTDTEMLVLGVLDDYISEKEEEDENEQ